MRPNDFSGPRASQKAKDVLANNDNADLPVLEFKEQPEMPERPEMPELTAPQFPELTLPEQANAEVNIPNVHLPDFFSTTDVDVIG